MIKTIIKLYKPPQLPCVIAYISSPCEQNCIKFKIEDQSRKIKNEGLKLQINYTKRTKSVIKSKIEKNFGYINDIFLKYYHSFCCTPRVSHMSLCVYDIVHF